MCDEYRKNADAILQFKDRFSTARVTTVRTAIDIAEIIAQTDASKAPVRLEYVRGRTK